VVLGIFTYHTEQKESALCHLMTVWLDKWYFDGYGNGLALPSAPGLYSTSRSYKVSIETLWRPLADLGKTWFSHSVSNF